MRASAAEDAMCQVMQAALNPQQWPDALRTLADACHADHAFAHIASPNQPSAFNSSGSGGLIQDFTAGNWHLMNSRMMRGLDLTRKGARGLLTEWHCFTPEELRRDAYHNEFANSHNATHYAARVVASHQETSMVFSVERSASGGAVMGRELQDANLLFEQLSRVLQHALAMQIDATVSVLNTLDDPDKITLWLDSSGRLLHATSGLEALLGSVLRIRNGRLCAMDAAVDETLQNAIARAGGPILDGDGPAVIDLGKSVAGICLARIFPFRGRLRDLLARASVLLSIDVRGPKTRSKAGVLRQRYCLTPAEIRFAEHIGAGRNVRWAAEFEGITVETARSRLKLIFQKTGTARQVELALLIERIR